MTMEHKAVLELDADVDNDNDTEKGVFWFAGDLEYGQTLQILPLLLSGQGSTLSAITSNSIDTVGDILDADTGKPITRAGYALEMGGGRHQFQINWTGWEGAQDANGNDVQWGTKDGSYYDATGEGPVKQMSVLMEFLRYGEYDSRAADARLRWGEYSDGTYSRDGSDTPLDNYIQVFPRMTTLNRTAEDTVSYDGSLDMLEIHNWTGIIDQIKEVEW
jgi:hypothetical protein